MRLFFVVIFLVGLMEPTSAIGGNPDNDSLQTDYRRLPAQVGENCTVGGTPLTEEDVALIVRGRRVPLHRLAVQEFLKNQEKYFAKLQPKGALFQEDLTGSERSALGRITWGWFLFGMYVLVALLFGGLSGYVAIMKGLSPVPNFFIGFVFSVPGYLYVLTRPRVKPQGEVPEGLVKVPTTSAPVPCPACGSMNHPSASKCAGCRTDLHPAVKSEVSQVLHQ